MALSIELNEIADSVTRARVENAIRDWLALRPRAEDWKAWIRCSLSYCEVTVEGPLLSRKRMFFDGASALENEIRSWLESYSLY